MIEESVILGASSSTVGWGTMLQVGVSRPDEVIDRFILLILPAALGPGVYSASNRNEYQKQGKKVSGE
jgi:hypothetical protein